MHPNCISHFTKREDPLQFEQEGLEELQEALRGIEKVLSVMRTSTASNHAWKIVMQEEINNLISIATNYREQFENEEE